jgi:4-aminobutyrate aminotransferase-like enzyme
VWQVLDLGEEARAAAVRQKAAAEGLRLGKGLPGCVVICPPLDVEDEELVRGAAILKKALG